MDLEKLEKMATLILKGLDNSVYSAHLSPPKEAEIKNLMVAASKVLPDHKEFFLNIYKYIELFNPYNAREAVNHLLAILEIEKTSEKNVKDMKIFESAEEKLKQAGLSFRKEDYSSTFHNLNTALELVLKDKIEIPTTITGINTSNIMDVLTKYKVEPFLYLEEARKHILLIDNKIKHQGYSPSKTDCINGIKAMENLIAKLRNTEMKLTEEIKKKIYDGL
jgi:HEPN domain-containing protein